MTADDLDLRVGKPFPGKMGQELVTKEMRIDSFLDTGLSGVPLDNLSNPPGGELILPISLKEMTGPPFSLVIHVLGKFSSKSRGNGNVPVLLSLSLIDSNLQPIEVHILQCEVRQLGISDAGKNQEFDHDHMGFCPLRSRPLHRIEPSPGQ